MKKVLIIVENLPVPFDTRVWKEATTLVNNGYEVFVISPVGRGYNSYYEFLDGVHIYRHPMPPERDGIFGYLLEYSVAFIFEFLLALFIFARYRFDVIQGCNPPDNLFLLALPFRLFGVKYIFDHHDANPELYHAKFNGKGILYKILLFLEKLNFRFSSVVISTNSSYEKLAIERGGVSPDRVFVVRNGPDPEKFKQIKPLPELKHGKKYLVGYVGTMSSQDGLDTLLEVVHYIKAKGRKDIHFTCVGGGPALQKLRAKTRIMRLENMLNFTGRISDEELLRVLSTADVCVNPDHCCIMNDISTMIKIMEYMALGKPIVQFDLTEGRFSARDASLYAEKNSVVDFAEKILWLLDQPQERRQMGQFGRNRIEEALAWKYSVQNLLAAYDRALNGNR